MSRQPYPLSYAQRALWYTYQLDPQSYAYNTAFVARVNSPVDVAAMGAAWQRLQTRHGSLRTRFAEQDGDVVQFLDSDEPFDFAQVDAASWSNDELERRVLESHRQPFTLAAGRVARVRLFTQAADRHVLLFSAHHIVIDAWSQWRLFDELRQLYLEADVVLADPPPSYVNYASWQKEWLATKADRAAAFWRELLSGELPILELPTDRPRPATRTLNGAAERFSLSTELAALVRDFAAQSKASVYVTALAAFAALLRRYTGQTDIVIGSPAANRTRREFADTVGCFVDMMPLRVDLSGNPTFRELVDRVRKLVFGATLNQSYPFGRMLEGLELRRDPRYSPVYQVSFVWDQPPQDLAPLLLGESDVAVTWGGMELRPFRMGQQEGQNDLMLLMLDGGQSLNGCVSFNTDLFDRSTVQRLTRHFQTLLENGVRDPDQTVGQLAMLPDSEREFVLGPSSRTLAAVDVPETDSVVAVFEQRVRESPDAVAVVSGDVSLTYGELNGRANQLARHLQTLGVGPDVMVALCVPRSLDMIVGILGVLKAGGAYVPLEPDWPAARQAFLLDDTRAAVVLTHRTSRTNLPAQASCVCLDADWSTIATQSAEDLPCLSEPRHLAYVIYTSGSTGQPKGVVIEHEALVTHCRDMLAYYRLTPNDRVLQFAAISFDPSVEQIFCTLMAGATLVLRDEDVWSAEEFVDRIARHGVTMCEVPAAYWRRLVESLDDGPSRTCSGLRSLRLMLVSGEQMPVDAVERWRRLSLTHIKLLNSYGPTETTITASSYEVPFGGSESIPLASVPIGRPNGDRRFYVLDEFRQPVPIGVRGELYIGSRTMLARGYLNRPDVTAERFVADPFCDNGRMYRTGDVCRWLPDGNVEFLGRTDFQVKIRGFRVELEEIEQVLRSVDGVRDAVVIARDDTTGNKQLVAYVVAASIEDLRAELSRRLPPYMVPAAIVALERLPLTSSGKLDRRALPEPVFHREERTCVPPRNPVETALCEIWQDVLRLPRVGIEDNFFELGGDSIQSIQVISRARSRGIRLTSRQVFQHPTVAALATVADGTSGNVGTDVTGSDFVAGASSRSHFSSQSAAAGSPGHLAAAGSPGHLAAAGSPGHLAAAGSPGHLAAAESPGHLAAAGSPGHLAAAGSPGHLAAAGSPGHLAAAGSPGHLAADVEDTYPLSPMQQGLLFHSLREPESGAYVVQLTVDLAGPLDVERFRQAWKAVQTRQPVLRTTLVWRDVPRMMQVVHRELPPRLDFTDLSALDEPSQQEQITRTLDARRAAGFDFACGPLWGVDLFRRGESRWSCTFAAHHVIGDGWSFPLLWNEFLAAYHEPDKLATEAAPRYRDYIDWLEQQDQLASKNFWTDQLDGFSASTPLTIETPNPLAEPGRDEIDVRLSVAETERLREFARRQRVTLNTLVQGAWALLLSRYSGEEDVCFGVTTSGRPAELPGVESMIGLFISTLPARVRVPRDEPVVAWLRRLQDQQAAARQFEYCSLVDVQRWSAIPAGTALFESLLVVENFPAIGSAVNEPVASGSVGALQVTAIHGREQTSFPLAIAVQPRAEMLVQVQFDRQRFQRAVMERLAGHLTRLLGEFVARPAATLGQLDWLTAEETRELLDLGRADPTSRVDDKCIPQLFEEQVERTPDATALMCDEQSLTYRELNARANQVARHLQSLGVAPETLVAICVERSLEMVVGVLGILKAGGAYVPLDPNYPRERLAAMLGDSQPRVIVTQRSLVDRLPHAAPVVLLDDHGPEIARQPTADLPPQARANHLAYVIYTSGSTGVPKGVLIEHASMAAHCRAMQDHYAVTPADRVLAFTALSFDPAVEQLFVSLIAGATIVLTGPSIWGVDEFLWQTERRGLTICDVPPAYWRQLLAMLTAGNVGKLASVRWFILGGEELPPDAATRWQSLRNEHASLRNVRVLNAYGPTETTITATCHELDCEQPIPRRIPIGRPVAGRQLYVVNHLGRLCSIGVPGELFIGGVCLARGYLNRDEQTAAAFPPNPFSNELGARWYRTGDRCRWLPDGNLEFFGRIDNQIKIRGFRVELGEIEAVLAQHSAVRESAVVARGESSDRRLVAYLVGRAGSPDPQPAVLREYLRQRLPEYMVPAAFVTLDAIPVKGNGKVDRQALPEPDAASTASAPHIAPRNRTEQAIATVWQSVLSRDHVGVDDNFFDLGGQSLLVVQVHGQLQSLSPNLTIVDLFNHPTIRALAKHIDGEQPTGARFDQAQDRAALQKRALQRRRQLQSRGERA